MTGLSPDSDLAQALGEAFESFEAIRQLARRYEDQSPDLFAAFLSAAAAAANGRDAVLTADVQPAWEAQQAGALPLAPGVGVQEAATAIAASALALAARLDRAAGLARTPRDRRACRDAADAARQIHKLLAAGDDTHAR